MRAKNVLPFRLNDGGRDNGAKQSSRRPADLGLVPGHSVLVLELGQIR